MPRQEWNPYSGGSGLRIWRECCIRGCAVQKIERLLERAVIPLVRWHIGLRARFFGALRLKVAAQGRLALSIGRRFHIGRYFLQHFDIGLDTFRLDRTAGWCEVPGRGQPQRAVAGSKRDNSLYRALAERARANQRSAQGALVDSLG